MSTGKGKTIVLESGSKRYRLRSAGSAAAAPVNRVVLEGAVKSKFKDFGDAVLHESAIHTGAEYIVTRNISDFKKSKLPTFSPADLMSSLELLNKRR